MKRFAFNLFLALLLGACASQAASKIPNPKIADAVRKLEHITDIDRNLTEEEAVAAMFLLGETDAWTDQESFLAMMKHESFYIRILAIRHVSRGIENRDDKVPENDPYREVLFRLSISDPVVEVRQKAIYGLRALGDRSACDTLVGLLDKPPPGNPKAVSDKSMRGYFSVLYSAIKNLKCPGTEDLFKPAYMDLKRIIEIYAKADPAKFFGDQTAEERMADESLNHMDPAKHYDELLAYINHESPVVRNRMVQAVAKSRRPAALAPLLKIIKTDPIIQVRDITINALGKLGDKRACPELEKLLLETEFGTNTPGTRNYLTPEKVHGEVRLTMGTLDCDTPVEESRR